jgi:hypothetical protein
MEPPNSPAATSLMLPHHQACKAVRRASVQRGFLLGSFRSGLSNEMLFGGASSGATCKAGCHLPEYSDCIRFLNHLPPSSPPPKNHFYHNLLHMIQTRMLGSLYFYYSIEKLAVLVVLHCSTIDFKTLIQHESSNSITEKVEGSNFSALGNAKYLKNCFVVRIGHF